MKKNNSASHEAEVEARAELWLAQICDILLEVTEYGVQQPDTGNLVRQIGLRMQSLRIGRAEDYLTRLRADPDEAHTLLNGLLNRGSPFFRDPEALGFLSGHVVRNLFEGRSANDPIRVWVPGCATGCEAYTLAMLLCEEADRQRTEVHNPVEIQIFATDIDPSALTVARRGMYPVGIAAEVSAARLNQFFSRQDGSYSVSKRLRDTVVFSVQTAISDPPYSKLDLISCRNLSPDARQSWQSWQLELGPLLYDALNEGGYLCLGPAENLAAQTDRFRLIDERYRIFQRGPGAVRPAELANDGEVQSSLDESDEEQPDSSTRQTIERLERELDRTRIDLESVVQNLHGASEDLKASNEELRSLHAEFQSANGELKISKAEIESGVEALAIARNDLQNLLGGIPIGTLFLDAQGNIKSFSHTISEIYNIRESDIGRPLTEITHKAYAMPPIPESLTAGQSIEDDIQTDESRWFRRRVLPYRHADRLSGLMLTFVDISQDKSREIHDEIACSVTQTLAMADSFENAVPMLLERLRTSLRARLCSLWVLDADSQELRCVDNSAEENSPAMQRFVDENAGRRFAEGSGLPGRVWKTRSTEWESDLSELRFERHAVAEANGMTCGMAMPIIVGRDFFGVIEFFSDHTMPSEQSLLDMLEEVGHEIGQFVRRSQLDDRFHDEEARKAAVLAAAIDCIITMDMWGKIVDFNREAEATFGHRFENVKGQLLSEIIIPERYRQSHREDIERFLESGSSDSIGRRVELVGLRSDGSEFPIEVAINVSRQRDGSPFFTAFLRDITERKEGEAKTLEQNGRFEALINAFAGVVLVVSPDGKIEENSESWREFTGQAHAESHSRRWIEAVHPADRELVTNQWSEAVRENSIFEEDFRLKHASDEHRWVTGRAVPRLDSLGNVTQWVAMMSDITEQRKLKVESEIRETRFAMALQAGEMVAWEWTPEQTYWPPEMNAFLGLSTNQEADIKTFFAKVHPEDLPALEKAWTKTISGEAPYYHEFRIHHGDGEIRWIAGQGEFVKDSDGTVQQVFGLNWDITEEHLSQSQLRESETFLRRTLDSLLTFVGVTLPDGTLVEVNASALRFTGWNLSNTIGKPIWDQFEFRPDPAVQESIRKAIEKCNGGRIVRLDLPIQLESGVSATIDAQFAPMLNEAGKITNIIFSAIDVTERKQAEEFLVDAQQQAELANQAKSEFLANMSHEIRTPMTAIIGYTDVLLENELDQQKRNWLLTIQRNGNFLLEIINDILDLSKIEAGRFEIDSQLFSPVAVVEDVRSVMDVRAQQNGLQLSVDYQGKLPVKIRSDLKRLKQILINLVGNAVKFTRTGSVKIVVDYESSDAPEIRIDVIDTGIGIAVDMQEELFQPFSQGEARISRDYGGTGLGLTISRRLAQMLGGHISVQSTVGVGSTFTIRMPVGVPAVELIDAESLEHPPEEVAPRAIELSCRVLVVDDRRDIRLLSRRLLTSSGADVTEAEDGVVAVERVSRLMEANEPLPDLILLDMQMPRMNGYDTAKQLRKMGFSGPIIALTAEAMEGDLQRCLDFGCDAYLSKPINAHKLRSTVQSYTS